MRQIYEPHAFDFQRVKGNCAVSETIHKSHNVSVLMYHFVCPAIYRRVVIDEEMDEVIKKTCEEIEKRYEIRFIEVGTDKDHVHFLIQSVPTYSPKKIIQIVKSIIAREVHAKAFGVSKSTVHMVVTK